MRNIRKSQGIWSAYLNIRVEKNLNKNEKCVKMTPIEPF